MVSETIRLTESEMVSMLDSGLVFESALYSLFSGTYSCSSEFSLRYPSGLRDEVFGY
ncbi:hypothetical protein AArcCO_4002 (plasmid) [Halalkaliarchaeum sp. AArc-CO]|nr:hypothetical protein AArcCO_4002 [Halalkaliarchaeum sp. AArc-CO]